jgi:hypothetical protein
MKVVKGLSKRQMAVIEALFSCEMDEQAILDKYRVSRNVYKQWLGDEHFQLELIRRMKIARILGEMLIAKYSFTAAVKLVQLTESEKEETARRACLDIISLPNPYTAKVEEYEKQLRVRLPELSDETASRILAALAEEKSDKQDG